MAKPETKLNRVRRYCTKIIARSDVVADAYGPAYTSASGWTAKRALAEALLRLMEQP